MRPPCAPGADRAAGPDQQAVDPRAQGRDVHRQEDEAEGKHPQAENGQDREDPAKDEGQSEGDAHQPPAILKQRLHGVPRGRVAARQHPQLALQPRLFLVHCRIVAHAAAIGGLLPGGKQCLVTAGPPIGDVIE